MSEEKKDFVVKDRRFFSEQEAEKKSSADDKKDSRIAGPEKDNPPETDTQPPDIEETAAAEAPASETRLPEINFSTFIFSLNASALVNLGILDNPADDRKDKNLPLAKQTIDILGMLEEKTSGNLTDEEKNLLKNILYDLRLNYVKEKK